MRQSHLISHALCSGCSSCAVACPAKAITMVKDEWGFPRPITDSEVCINCGLCEKVCPMQHKPERKERLIPPTAYAAVHKDEGIRMQSSSGGAFSAFASTILQEGGAVCGAAFDEHFRKVRHIIIEKESDMPKLRASKYVQSEMGDTFAKIRELLKLGRKVLFCGTPCQVAGLHLFLRREYDNLVTVDIVCHGVPSPVIYQDYIEWLEKKHHSEITSYNFRDKYWSWYHFNMKADFKNGSGYFGKWEEDPYFRGFLGDWFLRESCYSCPYSQHVRYADITLSDFWSYNKRVGNLRDDDRGISMCLPSTKKGENLLRKAGAYMEMCVTPLKAALSNGGFEPRQQTSDSRERFLADYREKGFAGCMGEYFAPIAVSDAIIKLRYRYGRNSLTYMLTRMLLPILFRVPTLRKVFNRVTGNNL